MFCTQQLEHHGESSPAEPIWLLTVMQQRSEANVINNGNIGSKSSHCCPPAGVNDDDDVHYDKAKMAAAKEGNRRSSMASNFWLLIGGRQSLCTAFSLYKSSNSSKL